MRISFSPQRRDETVTVVKTGDILTINGDAFDFSDLPDGATIPAGAVPCEFIAGPVERIEGELHLMLLLPHGPSPEPWQAFPEPVIDPPDGSLDLPWNTYSETLEEAVEGGTNVTTTTYRWHQEPEVETSFMPDPKPEPQPEEEPADVEG